MPIGSSRPERQSRRTLAALALALTLAPDAAAQGLSVRAQGAWHRIFDPARPPHQWHAPDRILNDALVWQPTAAAGVEYADATVSGDGEAWRIRLIAVRIDPAHVTIRTVAAREAQADRAGARWTLRQAPASAAVALNAGQFEVAGPWGWLVRRATELQEPGQGPLAMAFAVDDAGRAHFARGDSLSALRRSARVREGFQSWPFLLADDGVVPAALRDSTLGVRLHHRDARLAVGKLRDGRLLLLMTRFIGLGELLEVVPFGLTTPEMAAVMGALGCREAMLLDGGISSQLQVRTARGRVLRWPGLRAVPLGLVVEARR